MARITVEDCLTRENNRFALVLLASKRTKQILQGAKSVLDQERGNKAVVSSLREIATGKVRFMTPEEVQEAKDKGIELEALDLDPNLQNGGARHADADEGSQSVKDLLVDLEDEEESGEKKSSRKSFQDEEGQDDNLTDEAESGEDEIGEEDGEDGDDEEEESEEDKNSEEPAAKD